MADVTKGFKMGEEVRERVDKMVEASGVSSKEWFESLLRLAEMQQLKDGAPDFGKDLGELELHTNRIYQLVANMINRASHEKDAVFRTIDEVKASRDGIILGLQKELNEGRGTLAELTKGNALLQKEKDDALQQREQIQETLDHNKALIYEYKEKIDSLSTIINEYKEAVERNKVLEEEKRGLQQQELELQRQIERLNQEKVQLEKERMESEQRLIAQFEQEKQQLAERHAVELERQVEKFDLVRERAILQIQTESQEKIQSLLDAHATRIHELYKGTEKGNVKTNEEETKGTEAAAVEVVPVPVVPVATAKAKPKKATDKVLLPLSEIVIPDSFAETIPREEKIEGFMAHYREQGEFDKPITVHPVTKLLLDGYARYLAAQRMELSEVQVLLKKTVATAASNKRKNVQVKKDEASKEK